MMAEVRMMANRALRLAALLLAIGLTVGLAGCRTDSETERTKLPSIDGPIHKMEKSK